MIQIEEIRSKIVPISKGDESINVRTDRIDDKRDKNWIFKNCQEPDNRMIDIANCHQDGAVIMIEALLAVITQIDAMMKDDNAKKEDVKRKITVNKSEREECL
ncbi:5333_t:CDS:2, partial [Racocetra persica]